MKNCILRSGKWLWLPPSGYYGYISDWTLCSLGVVCHSESQKHLLNIAHRCMYKNKSIWYIYIEEQPGLSPPCQLSACLKVKKYSYRLSCYDIQFCSPAIKAILDWWAIKENSIFFNDGLRIFIIREDLTKLMIIEWFKSCPEITFYTNLKFNF